MLNDNDKLHMLEKEVRSNDLRLDTLERASHTLSLMHPPRQYFTENKETRDKFELLRCWMEYRLADGRLT
jgi:hypothetical protein